METIKPAIQKTESEWKEQLTPEQYRVTRKHATEAPFTGEYVDNHAEGVYTCVCCGAPLFSSEQKFDSGSGWPSFWAPLDSEHVGEQVDNTFFMRRVEVHCTQCGAHLGHVFNDGPMPTGERFCINSASLRFQQPAEDQQES